MLCQIIARDHDKEVYASFAVVSDKVYEVLAAAGIQILCVEAVYRIMIRCDHQHRNDAQQLYIGITLCLRCSGQLPDCVL